MNKAALVAVVQASMSVPVSLARATELVEEIFDQIVVAVAAGESVTLAGFGVFEARTHAARTGRNIRTGQPVAVPARTVPAFRAGRGFTAVVSGEWPAPHAGQIPLRNTRQ